MHLKPLHLVKGHRSYKAVKITHTFTMSKWFDHSCFEYMYLTANLWCGEPTWLFSSIMYRPVNIFTK